MRNYAFDVSFLLMSAPLDMKDARLVTPAKTNTNKTAAWSAWRAATRPSLLASVAWLVAGLPRRCTRTHTKHSSYSSRQRALSFCFLLSFTLHIHSCVRTCACGHAHAQAPTRARTHTHMHTHIHTHAHTRTRTKTHRERERGRHTRARTHTHTHTHLHTA